MTSQLALRALTGIDNTVPCLVDNGLLRGDVLVGRKFVVDLAFEQRLSKNHVELSSTSFFGLPFGWLL